MGPAVPASCDTHGPVLLERNKLFTRQRSQQRKGGTKDAFRVRESRLPTSPSIHLAVQGKSRTSSPSTPAWRVLCILQLQSHPSSSTRIFLGKSNCVKKSRLRRTKSMVKACFHIPGLSAIPLELKLSMRTLGSMPEASEPPRGRVGPWTSLIPLCFGPPASAVLQEELLTSPARPITTALQQVCATMWVWPGTCRSWYV